MSAMMSFDNQVKVDNVVDQVMNKFKFQTPMKYLGKLYVDRHHGNSLDQTMIQKVVKIIKDQAPKSGKVKTHFVALPPGSSATGSANPACLVCFQKNGTPLVKTAINNILSIGRIGTMFYYVTAGVEMASHNRYWVRAFDCRSKEDARVMCHQLMEDCNTVQPDWRPKKGTQLSLLSATSRGSAASGLSAQSAASGASTGSASSGWEGYENRKPVMIGAQGQVKSASQYALRAKMLQHGPPPARLQQQQQKAANFVPAYAAGAAPARATMQGSSKNLDDYIQVMDV
jgi:hypothetical protein